jgi:uncharacterized repeat protein (TIGR02543 family)
MKKNYIFMLFVPILSVFWFFSSCGAQNNPEDIPQFTVRFQANGGTPAPQMQTVNQGGKVAQPAAMTKTGLGFGGWFIDDSFVTEWDFINDIVIYSMTLFARWDINYHTVDFMANGGTPAPEQQNIACGSRVVMPPAMTKDGYTFGGWYKEATFIDKWNFANDVVRSNITIYAKWLDNFTVSFVANDGTPVPQQQSIPPNDKATMPPAMTKTGYTFDGWYREAEYINQWDFATNNVTEDITLYAKWLTNFTVSFVANGGVPIPQQIVADGSKVNRPENITKEGYYLVGWYRETELINQWIFDLDIVASNITLYAKWDIAVFVLGATLAEKFQWISSNAVSNTSYIIEVNNIYEELVPQSLFYSGKSNITIWLSGIGGTRTIAVRGVTIGNGVTLVLGDNISLAHLPNSSFVRVNSGGKLIMNGGKILGRTAANINGSVHVESNGTFIMNSGEISGNRGSTLGSGVFVAGIFTMNGGVISNNSAISGGGVLVEGIFTMNDGVISNNSATSGGGVLVEGIFTMNGGVISNNSATFGGGGGVFVNNNRTFYLMGGIISGNISRGRNVSNYWDSFEEAHGRGGGVHVQGGTLIIEGGVIIGNTSFGGSHIAQLGHSQGTLGGNGGGGGVQLQNGTLVMINGIITENSSIGGNGTGPSLVGYSGGNARGGGVHSDSSLFTMTGGEITGNTSSGGRSNQNQNSDGLGGGIFFSGGRTFTMNGGIISDNVSTRHGGGIYKSSGEFIMTDGIISSNTAILGGGVYINGDMFMSGGEISKNTVTASSIIVNSFIRGGGGVYISGGTRIFEKTGGTITGYLTNIANGNVVKNNNGQILNASGHAVFVANNSKRKETTAGPQDILLFIGRVNPPVFDGEWDN